MQNFFGKKINVKIWSKKVTELKSMNYFKGLGSYFDKAQRMRKLGGMISDELLISKEKLNCQHQFVKLIYYQN